MRYEKADSIVNINQTVLRYNLLLSPDDESYILLLSHFCKIFLLVFIGSLCDMPGFQQPIRIEQQLCSIAQFGGTKLPHKPTKTEVVTVPENFFDVIKAQWNRILGSELVLNTYRIGTIGTRHARISVVTVKP